MYLFFITSGLDGFNLIKLSLGLHIQNKQKAITVNIQRAANTISYIPIFFSFIDKYSDLSLKKKSKAIAIKALEIASKPRHPVINVGQIK